jgi:hypothetical protein
MRNNAPEPGPVSYTQASLECKDFRKKPLYDWLAKHQLHLIDFKSSLCTRNYLLFVKNHLEWRAGNKSIPLAQRYFCLTNTQKSGLRCLEPPSLTIVLRELEMLENTQPEIRLGIDAKHTPDKEWALTMIATLNPDHRFFKSDYTPKLHKEDQKTESHTWVVEDYSNLFADLPDNKGGKTCRNWEALKTLGLHSSKPVKAKVHFVYSHADPNTVKDLRAKEKHRQTKKQME